jgi:hypothetical protein
MSEKNDKILELVKQLKTKEFKTYFLVLDTKGNQVASMANIYDMALEYYMKKKLNHIQG